MGFDRVGRKTQLLGDPLIPHAMGCQEVDLIHGFIYHCYILSVCREELPPPGGGDQLIFMTLVASRRVSFPSRNS